MVFSIVFMDMQHNNKLFFFLDMNRKLIKTIKIIYNKIFIQFSMNYKKKIII